MTTANMNDQRTTPLAGVSSLHSVDDEVSPGQPSRYSPALKVSLFDAVTSFLLALVLFIGTLVMMLLFLWIFGAEANDAEVIDPPAVRVVSSTHPPGFELDFAEPGSEEVKQLREIAVQDELRAVTDAASRVAGAFVVAIGDQTVASPGENGVGDSRPPGPPSDDEGVPAFDRWQLNFSAKDFDSYARQLDFYEIELGVVGGSIQGVDYASHFSTQPRTRRGESESEKRLYFMWNRPGPLQGYDRRFLELAGVGLTGRQILKFIPPELEMRLTAIELEYARAHGHPSIAEIAKTIFESETTADGYRFQVIGQRYRKPQS